MNCGFEQPQATRAPGPKTGGSWGRPNASAMASSEPRAETATALPNHRLWVPALAGDSLQVHTGPSLRAFRSGLQCRRCGRTPWGAGQSALGGNPSTAKQTKKKRHFSVNRRGLNRRVEKCLLPDQVSGSLKSVLMAWVKRVALPGLESKPGQVKVITRCWTGLWFLLRLLGAGVALAGKGRTRASASEGLQRSSNCRSSAHTQVHRRKRKAPLFGKRPVARGNGS